MSDKMKMMVIGLTEANFQDPAGATDRRKLRDKLWQLVGKENFDPSNPVRWTKTSTGVVYPVWSLVVRKADGTKVYRTDITKADVQNWIDNNLPWLKSRLFIDYGSDAVAILEGRGLVKPETED